MPTEQDLQLTIQRLLEVSKNDIPKILKEVVKLEKETWPEKLQATKEKFQARAEIFPEGFLVISLPGFGLVGVSTAEIIDYDPNDPPISWEKITDNGWIRATHNLNGNALYLVSVGTSPAVSGRGVGTRLVKEQIDLTKKLQLPYMVLGSRVPGYAAYHQSHAQVGIDQYLDMKRDGDLIFDPEIRFYARCGLEIVKIVPNYMEDDPASENYGVVMIWKNPLLDLR